MPTFQDIERDDPTFVEDLIESQVYVERVASWLCELGYEVEIQPLAIRPSVEQMREYSDNGDLKIKLCVG